MPVAAREDQSEDAEGAGVSARVPERQTIRLWREGRFTVHWLADDPLTYGAPAFTDPDDPGPMGLEGRGYASFLWSARRQARKAYDRRARSLGKVVPAPVEVVQAGGIQ